MIVNHLTMRDKRKETGGWLKEQLAWTPGLLELAWDTLARGKSLKRRTIYMQLTEKVPECSELDPGSAASVELWRCCHLHVQRNGSSGAKPSGSVGRTATFHPCSPPALPPPFLPSFHPLTAVLNIALPTISFPFERADSWAIIRLLCFKVLIVLRPSLFPQAPSRFIAVTPSLHISSLRAFISLPNWIVVMEIISHLCLTGRFKTPAPCSIASATASHPPGHSSSLSVTLSPDWALWTPQHALTLLESQGTTTHHNRAALWR